MHLGTYCKVAKEQIFKTKHQIGEEMGFRNYMVVCINFRIYVGLHAKRF